MIQFVVKRAKRGRLRRGQWVCVIKAGNGEVLFVSETMSNKADAQHAAQVVISGVQQGALTESSEG